MPSLETSLVLTGRQKTGLAIVAATAGIGLGLALARALKSRQLRPERSARGPATGAAKAARALNRASATLAVSVMADSAVEHYRGMFHNRAMPTPVVVAALMFGASLHGARERGRSHPVRHGIQALAGLTGLAGMGFHAWNLGRREGGISWTNLFYAAPIGAPFALTLAGALGVAAEALRDGDAGPSRLLGLPAGPAIAGFAAFGLFGTVAEAGLFHFRGAFQNPFMLVPVTLPPVAALLLARASSTEGPHPATRWALRATAVTGIAGVALHAYGVSRMMGGFYNWSQNVLDGPPLPAPPAFTGMALAGLAALDLLEASPAESRTLYPGYDVLAKRDGPSWNRKTREVVERRLAVDPAAREPFDEREWRVLTALCDRIMPQPPDRGEPVPLPAMVAAKVTQGRTDGFRSPDMPPLADSWRRGLAALDAEAEARHGLGFPELGPADQDALLSRIQDGDVASDAWGDMPPKRFFSTRILHDITSAYYGHPTAWSEIGFGGPASPRGYVRMDFGRRDPWEPVEATPGKEDVARRINLNVR